ncbi:Uu.00g018920.m01.CDS01 [Anthostomella pinea]|uniref:Uu.00g018920.m01.CDS01 n=1 Tax=Anthostomella pinea TaxID=933095 RepID=A0AAI8YQN0_9PEZI|nr:Uu.00g018920.m01.CDS01 [Anthostomella pinea]
MSGPGEQPDCSTADYTDKFFEPTSQDTFHPGDTVEISWFAEPPQNITSLSEAIWALTLQRSGYTGDEPNNFSFTIQGSFFSLYGRATGPESWTIIDECDDTAQNYTWYIPSDIDISFPKFALVARNLSDGGHARTSDPFLIEATVPAPEVSSLTAATSTSSSLATSNPTSSGSVSPSTTSTSAIGSTPTSSPSTHHGSAGLSTGAKAGIGAAVPLAVIAVVVGLWAFWKRRPVKKNAQVEDGPVATSTDMYEKAELPADNQTRMEPVELDGGGIEPGEMDTSTRQVHTSPSPQAPVELSP